MLSGRYLITGGAGFLARAIYRRAAREGWNVQFTALSRDDTKHVLMQRRFPWVRCIRGDVAADRNLLRAAMAGQDGVIHAAASKYVDLSEFAAWDTVRTNIVGSQNVLMAAFEAGIPKVVAISTDKACSPVNVYGMTKATMERLFVESAKWADWKPTCVRYGNVVGSTGSVIPMFQRQLAEFGHVKVTNPAMTRFWMGADEAIDLILLALSDRVQPGSVVIPYVKAMPLGEVVQAACGDDVPVQVIGERAGEKRDERLIHYEESVRVVRHEDFFELRPPGERVGESPFTLSSNLPQHWMTREEMRDLIADAATI